MFRKVIIIGVGQIGASIGMNLRSRKLAQEVIGFGRDVKSLKEAIRRKAIHDGQRGSSMLALRLSELSDKDLIILSTPVQRIRHLLRQMPKGPLVLDVGSTKAAIVAEASKRKLRFIGCHPIAGTEVPGAKGADENLFQGKVCLITPSSKVEKKDIMLLKKLWRCLGAKVVLMEPSLHDRLLAAFSHLPHILAYSLMMCAPVDSVPKALFKGLGSFRSATRVAASSPEMWHDILLENRSAILKSIDDMIDEMKCMSRLIRRCDEAGLLKYLMKSQKKRLKIQGYL